MLNGGYIIVSVADTNIYEKVNNALINGKPILFYDDTETAYYIDTISKDGDGNIILTKGGKTFTITDVNSVMATGEVVNHLYINHIYFYCENENEVTAYFYFNIVTDKVLTKDEMKNYIQTNTGTNKYIPVSGYDGDEKVICSIFFYNDNYQYNANDDSTYVFNFIDEQIYINSLQLF